MTIEVAELALAFLFGLMAWSAARDNRLAAVRYWERDAERRRILNPVTRQPYTISDRVWYTTSQIIGIPADSGYSHAVQRSLIQGRIR